MKKVENEKSKVMETKQVHAGFVAIVGPANGGKSSLFNALINYKVAAISPKVQSTRKINFGIYNAKKGQLVFMDAPGFMEERSKKKNELEKFMIEQALKAIRDSDIVLLVVSPDLQNVKEQTSLLLQQLKKYNKELFMIINKSDLKQKCSKNFQDLEKIIQEEGCKALSLSKSKEDALGRKELLSYLIEKSPLQEAPFYDQDIHTPHSLSHICRESIYENCLQYLHQELPYQLAISIRTCEKRGSTLHILGEIITAKKGHKAMIVGQGGKTLKKISQKTREQLEKRLKTSIFIRLQVQLQPNWTKDKKSVKAILS